MNSKNPTSAGSTNGTTMNPGMPEPTAGASMPQPASFSTAMATAPGAGAGDSPVRDAMPVPTMDRPAANAGMPGTDMSEPRPGAVMPAVTMAGGSDTNPEATRFGPPDLAPGESPAPAWEPGVVEVEFKDGVTPTITAGELGATVRALAPGDTDPDGLARILRAHGLERAEPSLEIPPVEAAAVQTSARAQGIELPNLAAFVTLHFPPNADTPGIARELAALESVARAVPVPRAIPPLTPLNEPLVGTTDQAVLNPVTGLENQWYIFRTRANHAWSLASGAGVVIADIDFGFRTTHQDLAPRLEASRLYNSVDGSANVSVGAHVYHGTGVLGLAGGDDNNLGMAGVAPAAALWAVQANTGAGASLGGSPWARGIDWVRTTNSGGRRKVIILEVQTAAFGNYEQVPSVNAAIRAAIAAGVVVCVAAGNGNRDAAIDDAGNPIPPTGSILVGATEYHATENRRAGFSNFGVPVVVCAPGDSAHDVTCSSTSDNGYRNNFGGTSGATPKVAGTVALMLSANPALTHAQIRDFLRTTGGPVVTAAGRAVGTFLNCEAAVRAARTTAPGRLEVFARGGDQSLFHKWQTAPNNGWSGWGGLGGWIDLLSVNPNQDGRLEVFARGSDRALWHQWQVTPGGGWSGWSSLGGWIDLLTTGRNADGRLEVFVRGSDGAVYHRWQTAPNSGWSGWASLGGVVDRLAVGSNADGRLELFARGTDGALWHKWQVAPNGTWSGWASLGGWIDMIAVGQNADGRLEAFVRGSDGAVHHRWQVAPNGTWSGWASLGGRVDRLAVGRNADGRLEVFARGTDGALWHQWQVAPNGTWSGWASLGGWIDRLAVGRNADGRLEVFARGSDGALWHQWQTAPNNGWSGWASLGGWIDLLDVAQNSL
jgi:hypothetical protein